MEITTKEWKAIQHIIEWTEDVCEFGEMDGRDCTSPNGIKVPTPEEYEMYRCVCERANILAKGGR